MSINIASAIAVLLLLGVGVAPALSQAPPALAHETEGRAQCLMCHAAGALEPVPDVPASHAERPNETCLWCHAPDAKMQTVTPKVIPHETEGRETCLMCHTAGVMEPVPDVPADHDGRGNEFCGMCHTAAKS